MNKYVSKLFGIMFQSKQAQQIVRVQPQQHLPTSPEAWRDYWQSQNQPWRTEPEIDEKRQRELSQRRAIVPNMEQGIYPFKGMKLSRADIEWLLATHENGRGPVNWSDEQDRQREGVDLRGADLDREDLGGLPLACLRGGLRIFEWFEATEEERVMAVLSMQKVNLRQANLQQATLVGANLQQATLSGANLQQTDLSRANLQQARIEVANLQQAQLVGTNLQQASLQQTDLQEAYLGQLDVQFFEEGGNLRKKVHIEGANLQQARLKMANLQRARLVGASLQQADLRGAWLDKTSLENAVLGDELYIGPLIVDVQWGDTNLAVVDWSKVKVLGDEYKACQKQSSSRERKDKDELKAEYQAAVRANRQLAIALQAQGLNEDAARFAYRAQTLQRKVFLKQREFGKWLFSLLLALLAGYGYRMWRILVAYLFIVLLCAVAYFVLGIYYEPHLSFLDAVLTSITAFHGRVFSEPFLHPGAPQLWVTAFEAVMGLVIEGVFIAMLTQKFFGK